MFITTERNIASVFHSELQLTVRIFAPPQSVPFMFKVLKSAEVIHVVVKACTILGILLYLLYGPLPILQ